MFKRLLSILLVVLLLSGCSAPPPSAEGTPFTDDADRTVTVANVPEKVAVLFSSLAEIWQLAGGTVSVTVGESVERGFCPETTPLVDSGAGKTIDTERLLSHQPDLVIGSADIEAHRKAAALLEQAGIPCALFRVESFPDYLRTLKTCTDLTQNPNAYRKYGIDLQAQIDAIKAQNEAAPSVLLIRSGSSASSAKAKRAADHFAAAMLEELGCRNIADNAPVLLDGLSLEEILRANPHHIFIVPMGDEQAAKVYMQSVLEQPAWQALSAVENGNVHFLPKALFQYKPNARWGEAYQYLAEIINQIINE